METLKKIRAKLNKIEKTLKKFEKHNEYEIEDLIEIEQDLSRFFNMLEEREEFFLNDVKTEENKVELVNTVNCINLCDKLWNQYQLLQKRKKEEGEPEEYVGYEREVWEMMFPNEDIDSNDFEVGDYNND